MKTRERISLPAVGGCSLLVIFGVLCLVVFSLLSLNAALAERRISEASAQRVRDWYAADLRAQEIFAGLRNGRQMPGVEQTGGTYTYSVPVSGRQTLVVTLQETGGRWEILSWRAEAHPGDGDETLPVWQGRKEEEYA